MSDLKDQPAAAKSYAVAGFSEWQIRTGAAVKNERYRIVNLILEEIAYWKGGDEVTVLKRLLQRIEDTPHE